MSDKQRKKTTGKTASDNIMFRNLKSLKIYKLLPDDDTRLVKSLFGGETIYWLFKSFIPIILILVLTFLPIHYKGPPNGNDHFHLGQTETTGRFPTNPYPPTSVFQILTGYGSYTPLDLNLLVVVISVYAVIMSTLVTILCNEFKKYSSEVFNLIIECYLRSTFFHLKTQNIKNEINDLQLWRSVGIESCSKCKESDCEEEGENSKTNEKILVRDCEPDTRDELPKGIFEG